MIKETRVKKFVLLGLVICFAGISSNAQSAHALLRKADKDYEKEDYTSAEEGYRKSIEKRNDLKARYNLGNSTYKQNRFEEAIEHYSDALNMAETDRERSNAHYNLGNSLLKNGSLEESIESYKSALKYDPTDDEIRKNLFLAKLMQQQQQQQQQQDQNEENENQKNQNQQNQNQQQDQQENQNSQQKQQDQQISNQDQQQETAEAQDLSKEDALKLLEVIENEEKNVQEKLRKVSGKKKNIKKDW